MTQTLETCRYTPPNWLDPLDWSQVFGRSGPVEVEIGCGKGTFLVWAAAQQPDRNFLGIERLLDRLRKADRKTRRLGLTNIRLLRLEASYVVGKLIPPGSVAAYHILFPDPWPKRRHAAHRLFQPAFVSDLHRTLIGGGTRSVASETESRPRQSVALQQTGVVNFATDSADYFAEVRQVMPARGEFGETAPPQLPVEAQTDFEREFRAAGKPIYRTWFVRRG
jgi:tRNA (guanine-N7-)-methyltransferase